MSAITSVVSTGTPAWRVFRWFALFAAVLGTISQWWNGQEWWLMSSLDQAWEMGQWVRRTIQDVSQ